jgi:ankyrin repeat protein
MTYIPYKYKDENDFLKACIYEQTKIIKNLLDNKHFYIYDNKSKKLKNDINDIDEYGNSALIYLVDHKFYKFSKQILLLPELEYNHQNDEGDTALITACCVNNIVMVKELLKFPYIDVNLINCNLETALYIACINGYFEIVKELLKFPYIDYNYIKTNIENDLDGTSILMIACCFGYNKIAKELLKMPCINYNYINSDNESALSYATENNSYIVEIIKNLMLKELVSCRLPLPNDILRTLVDY